MAKIDEATLVPDATVGTRGVMVGHRPKRGAYVHKWPRKRGKWATPADFYRQQEFGWVARGVASPQPTMLATAINYAKGADQVPRDILMMAAYGMLYELTFLDGTPIEYYRMVAPNAQLILDQVTDTPGAMMYRSPLGWIEIPPGNDADVMAIVNQQPQWLPGFIPTPANAVGPTCRPYFRDSTVYLCPATNTGTVLSGLALTAGVQYLMPIMVPQDRAFTTLAASFSTAVAASNCRLCLANNDPTDGGPTTIIEDSGNISTAVSGLKTHTMSHTLQAGPYWLGVWLSNGLTIRGATAASAHGTLGFALGAGTAFASGYLSRAVAFGTAWSDMTGVTFNVNAGSGVVPMPGIR